MPSLKAIRKRIASVKSTQQITKAMKMVSAAKLRRAQEAAVASRPYAAKLGELLGNVGDGVDTEAHPLLRSVESTQATELLVVTSDRGLCGAYNANLIRQAANWLADNPNGSLTIVGRKGVEYFRRREVTVRDKWTQNPSMTIELAREIAAPLRERFVSGEVDRVDILYAKFRSALSQDPTIETVLPVPTPDEPEEGDAGPSDLLLEPDADALLSRLLPQFVEVKIFQALLEGVASEHGARMTAMDSASRNAGDMIFKLTLQMNRARQAAITTELMEIVGGAEALRG